MTEPRVCIIVAIKLWIIVLREPFVCMIAVMEHFFGIWALTEPCVSIIVVMEFCVCILCACVIVVVEPCVCLTAAM